MSMFGLSIAAIDYLWEAVIPHGDAGHPKYILWLLYFIKNYAACGAAHCVFRVAEKTYCVNVWKVMHSIDRNLHSINFNTQLHDPMLGNVFLVIDTTVCPIQVDRTDWATL